ncbi:MAG TPA: aryl-sulfate sulfotransferase [Terriglobales bacterium]|nr:aryl-sulfate sulfotransferase [Terriglobales bacterium]
MSTTANPQVAMYSVYASGPGKVSVQFGLDTQYGLTTWAQTVTTPGAVDLFVAGMRANTAYHMRAVLQRDDGTQFLDGDHVFTTGGTDPATVPAITSPGKIPQGGVELLTQASGTSRPLITDLQGNVLWTYDFVPDKTVPNPMKLLPNGHFLINFSEGATDGLHSVIQEIDLSGTLIWQMTADDLNAALADATCAGCNITVVGTHHDFVLLPNGHLVVIAATQEEVSGTTVTGDVIIDLDENHKPVWIWNEFDHLDINRRPFAFPDWTHTNAMIYSPDDGNLIISLRHQNWLIKIDYADGLGAGDIVWKLGYQGDFKLVGGSDPEDWFYAQHGPSFTTEKTSDLFSLVLFDNGDDRVFPAGVICNGNGAPPCLYSTVPILQLDESAKTATLVFHPKAPTYSFFGGNAEVLANGNVEFCEAAGGPGTTGVVYEITQDDNAEQVWRTETTGNFLYRGQRLPSFYPGVQW